MDCAGQGDIRQIVMATHGYTGLKRWRHGSVAERVLQAAGVPVLLVRAGEKEAKDSRRLVLCRRILVPLDGSAMAEQVLPIVMPIALALDAEIDPIPGIHCLFCARATPLIQIRSLRTIWPELPAASERKRLRHPRPQG